MPYNPQRILTSSKIKPQSDPAMLSPIAIRLPGGVTYSAGQVLEEVSAAAANEVQLLTVDGTPTGGTFVLGYPSLNGGFDVTSAIAYNAAASAVQTALEAVLGTGNVTVTGSAGGPWTVTYASEMAARDVPLPTLVTNSLTGGSSPTVTPSVSTAGSGGLTGCMQAYTTGPARAILEATTRTAVNGAIIDEFGNTNQLTAVAFNNGDWLCSDLVGLDDDAVTDLGKIIFGATRSTTGAVLRIH